MRRARPVLPARLALLPLFAALAGVASPAAPAASIRTESFESGGRRRTCAVYVPGSAKADAKAPLLLLLHGSGGNGAGFASFWKELADEKGVLLAAPDALDRAGWEVGVDGPNLLGDAAALVASLHPVDATRIYLFGHSGGAVFALSMGPMESEFFAAVALDAGAWRYGSDSAVLAYASRKVPFFLSVGTKDPFFPIEVVRETRATLRSQGFPAELLEFEGQDHDYRRRYREVSRRAWEFLSSHRLAADGRFKVYSVGGRAENAAPDAVVQRQLDAYNAHDLPAFLATYAEDAELYEYPSKLLARGRAQLGERYSARFREPNLRAELLRRTAMASFVVDHERVARSFPEGPGTSEAVVLYEVQGGLIVRSWLVPGPKTLAPPR